MLKQFADEINCPIHAVIRAHMALAEAAVGF